MILYFFMVNCLIMTNKSYRTLKNDMNTLDRAEPEMEELLELSPQMAVYGRKSFCKLEVHKGELSRSLKPDFPAGREQFFSGFAIGG
jgi:hypothetical protein